MLGACGKDWSQRSPEIRMVRPFGLILALAAISLSACSSDEAPILMNIQSKSRTPDEFTILPRKPMVIPEDLASLPPPTPGGGNRTDPTPEADMIVALGGNPASITENGQRPTSDSSLVNYASRYGVTSDIREQLAAEDLAYRQKNNGRLLERWFNQNVYFDAYQRQNLNKYSELERFRRAGVDTVAAPPNPAAVE